MSRPAIMAVMGVLALVALAYFGLVIRNAEPLAAVLLRRGYQARGWTEAKLASRLRILGVVGAVAAIVSAAVALTKVFA